MDLCIFRPQGEPDREYPAHIDMDLKENYDLEEITVDLPEEGYSQYRIFTSRDGRDFELLAVKDSRESCDPEICDVFDAGGREARIIRLYIEYNAASTKALWKEVKVTGEWKTGAGKTEAADRSLGGVCVCGAGDGWEYAGRGVRDH